MLRSILTIVFLVAWVCPSFSQQGSPGKPEGKTETAQQDDNKGSTFDRAPGQFPFWFLDKPSAPVVNVYTGKHAGEKSQCAEHKDWKEWGAFAWCRGLEWIDTERVIAVFTVILGVATWLLWGATKSLVKGAEETAKHQLRAYVFIDKAYLSANLDHKTEKIVGWATWVVWKNNGQTPTKNARMRVNKKLFDSPLPDGYEFPDFADEDILTLLGPHSEVGSTRLKISSDELESVKSNKKHLYTWGWVEYDDIFPGTPRHRTEFCHKWNIGGDLADAKRMHAGYDLHREYNGAEEECDSPLRTESLKI